MFTIPKSPPEALNFSAVAGLIASAHGNSIHVWGTSTGNTLATYDEHPGSINALVLSPDSITLATASGDWKVRLWDVLAQATTSAA